MPPEASMINLMEKIYAQVLVAFAIVILCVFIILYIFGLISLPFLDNNILKVIVTVIVFAGFALYLFLLFKNRVKMLHIIGFSLLFDAIGYWWLNVWIGYVFIGIGFGLLIYSFVKVKV